MNKEQIDNLIIKQADYLRAFDQLYSEFLDIAHRIQQSLLDAYREVYPERDITYNNHRWMKFADSIDIEIENGHIIAKYTEIGRWGNNDELLYELRIDNLITEQQQDQFVAQWVTKENESIHKKKVEDHVARMTEIATLERKLAELRNS